MTLHEFMTCTSTTEHIIVSVHLKGQDKGFGAVLGVREYLNQPVLFWRKEYHDWKVHDIRVQNGCLRIDLYEE